MTTPNHVSQHRRAEPVPQWCYDAAEEIIGHSATYIAAIIARHAPQAEPPQPAPRYACSKLAAVGDTVKVLGSEPPLIMKVEELSTTGGLYIKSLTGTACMLLNSSQVEFVPEIPPAAAVWPRYFEQRNCRGPYKRLRFESPTVCKWADGHASHLNLSESMPKIFSMEAVLQTHIETDAEGNALPEKQEASGVERDYDLDLGGGEDNLRSQLVALDATHRKLRTESAAKDATIAELQGEIDRLKQDRPVVSALRTRAEAAEAKCAEYRNTFTAANEMRLSEVRLRHQVQQRADDLTSQLAAATEKLRVVEGERDGLKFILQNIARPHDCGCRPCTGQCRSKESLEIDLDGIRDLARSALSQPGGGE